MNFKFAVLLFATFSAFVFPINYSLFQSASESNVIDKILSQERSNFIESQSLQLSNYRENLFQQDRQFNSNYVENRLYREQNNLKILLDEYMKIIESSHEKIFLEGGVSIFTYTPYSSNLVINPGDYYLYTNSFIYPGVGFGLQLKINLINPKIPQPGYALARIKHFYAIQDSLGISLGEKRQLEIQKIENDLESYKRKKWFRPSISLLFPLTSDRPNGYNSGYSSPDVLSSSYYYERMAIFVGYDIFDIITVQFGVNFKLQPSFSIYLDITTPTYAGVNGFINFIAKVFRQDRQSWQKQKL